MARRSALVRVRGTVQGVWFRGWTEKTAREHGLDGWVRNLADGSVELLLAGEEASVEQMLDDCWQGPPAARVTSVEVSDADPSEAASIAGRGFAVRDA